MGSLLILMLIIGVVMLRDITKELKYLDKKVKENKKI